MRHVSALGFGLWVCAGVLAVILATAASSQRGGDDIHERSVSPCSPQIFPKFRIARIQS